MTSIPSSSLKRLIIALTGVLVVVLALGVFPHGRLWVADLDRSLHDQLIRWTGGAPEREDFVLLGIDEASLSLSALSDGEIAESETLQMMDSRFPWDRRVWAAAIDRLGEAGARLIVIDLVFAEPSGPEEDDALAAAIARHRDKVILTSVFAPVGQNERGHDVFVHAEPYVRFLETDPEPRIGFANFPQDPNDGYCRVARYRSSLGLENGKPLNGEPEMLSLAGQVIDAMGGEVPYGDRELSFTKREETGGTEYYSPRSLYEIFSEKLWKANYDDGRYFEDKVVMLGPVAPRFQDIKKTPAGPLFGPQLHLQAAACGLEGAFVRRVDRPVAIMIGMGLLGALFAGWLAKPWASAQGMLLLFLVVAVVIWLLGGRSIMIPVTGGFLAASVGWVAAQVYQLVRERLEKGRLRGEFRRFVSRDVADRLVDHPESWAAVASGRKRKVVVLFSDVRDFTSRSEQSDPVELVDQLNEYLTAMVAVVFRHGGTLDKFIGDAVMAHWGALDYDEGGGQARSAIAAGREMHEALNDLNRRWEGEGRAPFRMGVGIHLGDAVAGELGSPDRIEFGVIGDAVNLASRIEGLTKVFACDVMFSEQVREAAGEEQAMDLGRVRVKGRAAPVQLYGFGDEAVVRDALAKLDRDEEGVVVMTSK